MLPVVLQGHKYDRQPDAAGEAQGDWLERPGTDGYCTAEPATGPPCLSVAPESEVRQAGHARMDLHVAPGRKERRLTSRPASA